MSDPFIMTMIGVVLWATGGLVNLLPVREKTTLEILLARSHRMQVTLFLVVLGVPFLVLGALLKP